MTLFLGALRTPSSALRRRMKSNSKAGSASRVLNLALVVGCVLAVAPSNPAVSSAPRCEPPLLARTPRYDTSQVTLLAGHYRWVSVDTVSTRESPPGRVVVRGTFRLWATHSISRPPRHTARLGYPALGPISGAVEGFDQTGFSADHPQIQVRGRYLELLYDPRVGRGLLDGGHVMEELLIDVLGTWGFGGYYDTRGDLIAVADRNGNP